MDGQSYSVPHSLFTDYDITLFKAGKHFRLYEKLGSHVVEKEGEQGVLFSVWAPSARKVEVLGDFNYWNGEGYELYPRWDSSGIFEAFVPGLDHGTAYKYKIESNIDGRILERGDPFAAMWETPPKTASIVWQPRHRWADEDWLNSRASKNALDAPYSVYEVHLGSWKRNANGDSFTYRQMADELVEYVQEMGYTHVEFLPVMEHPFFGSWGYQITGYFAPSSRYGSPEEFKMLVDTFHQAGIGVILDWVPSHFPGDSHGLYEFDGSHLYEHPDRKKGYHPDWESYIFNYGRNEVRAFLISNALFWLDNYHIDGLRVDAVASMLYLDYSREEGEWEPNIYGGRENLDAISFMKEFNEAVYKEFPDVQTIAEESTSYPMISRPTFQGGLGFGMKWMMGWMHDTLAYFKKDPVYRKFHQNDITFSMTYAFTENFLLPLSHDEVVHGKGALMERMPGDEWQRFANMRALFSYMFTHPGTKLLFMGADIGQTAQWKHDQTVEWHLLTHNPHKGIQSLIRDLNKLYKTEPALHLKAFSQEGFQWIEHNDAENCILSYLRFGHAYQDMLLVAVNLTPVIRRNYRIGVSDSRKWKEIFNSDNEKYGGSGVTNGQDIFAEDIPYHGRTKSVNLTLPPLGVLVLKQS